MYRSNYTEVVQVGLNNKTIKSLTKYFDTKSIQTNTKKQTRFDDSPFFNNLCAINISIDNVDHKNHVSVNLNPNLFTFGYKR